MSFVQTIAFLSHHEDQVKKLLDEWNAAQVEDAPGYRRATLLSDREKDNTYLIIVEFSSYEEAMRNSERPETNEWAEKLRKMAKGELSYRNHDAIWGG